jgi:hypothetical protein
VGIEVVADGVFEFGDAGEDAAPNALAGDLGKEALDQIEPGRRGRDEVQLEARVLGEPGLHRLGLVSGVVVDDQVQVQMLARGGVDGLQEADELLGPMPRLALPDHRAGLDLERGEQRGRAMTLVVVRHCRRPPLLQRQAGLGAVQRLDLALLINAQHQRFASAPASNGRAIASTSSIRRATPILVARSSASSAWSMGSSCSSMPPKDRCRRRSS